MALDSHMGRRCPNSLRHSWADRISYHRHAKDKRNARLRRLSSTLNISGVVVWLFDHLRRGGRSEPQIREGKPTARRLKGIGYGSEKH